MHTSVPKGRPKDHTTQHVSKAKQASLEDADKNTCDGSDTNSTLQPKPLRIPLSTNERLVISGGYVPPAEETIAVECHGRRRHHYLLECGHYVSESYLVHALSRLSDALAADAVQEAIGCSRCAQPMMLQSLEEHYVSKADHLAMQLHMAFPGARQIRCSKGTRGYRYTCVDAASAQRSLESTVCLSPCLAEDETKVVDLEHPRIDFFTNFHSQRTCVYSVFQLFSMILDGQSQNDDGWINMVWEPDSLSEAIEHYKESTLLLRNPVYENNRVSAYVYRTH
jgi:hypothetical protein